MKDIIEPYSIAQNKIDKSISFDFYTLTTDSQSKIPKNINVKVNLIKINGTREDEITNANCILNNNIINNNYASQAHYICTIKNLNEDYHSFRFNNSEFISGVPDDEYYLDPYMTKKYINENKIDDVLKIGLPTTFIIKSINYDTCNKNGIFTILGDMSQELSQSYIFKIPLKQPDIGIISTCNITNNQIECKVDREINDNIIAIEETIIKENYKEILLLSNAKTKEKITCKNALYEDSTKKKEINISFRQISHLTQITNGFSFYLITLMNQPYKKDYQFNININIFINQIKTEKNAICILENNVSPNNGLIEQGNFKCTLNLTNDEYNKADFKTISISLNNDNINGVSDLDEITANPYKTDEFIKEVNNKKSKGEKLNNITDIFDYYSENIKFSPILNIDSINIDDCQNKGKLYLIGKLSDDINQKMIFDLPLTYPNTEIKCELEKVKKDANINITCKTQTKFENIENIIIESRLIKKKNLEQLFINGKEINFEAKKSCENYNAIKVQISKKRQKTKFTFLHLSKFNPIKNGLSFFISLIRNALEYDFYEKFTFTIKILITNKRYLRYLEDAYQSSIPVLCNLNQELKSNYAAGYDCSNTVSISGTPTDMKIETEYLEDISGIPDNNDQEYLKGIIDYTNINNLKAIDKLPIVNITNINGDTCSENGQYIITAKYANNKNNNLKNKYNNVVIRFDSPESSGLCQININDIITMTCENKEKFAVSQILIERNVVQDQEGNDIFIVNSYTNLEVFGCDISYNSIINDNSNEQTEKISYLKYRNTKNGLTGGAIAGIIIACIAVIAAIIIVVVLANKGIFIEKQGNFGNMFTGDGASAPRYIECRVHPLAKEFLVTNPHVTHYIPNYDGRSTEPEVYRAKIPVALIIGAEGIAVGMSTKILPYNIKEVLEAEKKALKGESFELYPDVPTGGLIDVSNYNDGNGKIITRAKFDMSDEKKIVITELPVDTTSDTLMNSIENAYKNGRIKIGSIEDFTTDHCQIEIKLPRGVYAKDVEKALYAYTDCEKSISCQMLVIKDGMPVSMTATEIIKYYAKKLTAIIKDELEFERGELTEELHARTLERIFVEERIYKKIEQMKTAEAVNKAVKDGFKPFKDEYALCSL